MTEAIVRDSDGWSVLREPRRVDQVQVDFRFGIALDDGTLIVIESPFTATIDGVAVTVTPETLDGVGDVLAVLHRTVTKLCAFRTGALRVEFSDGGVIEVAPGVAYENWQLLLSDGSQLVGLPGGDVATFPPSK